MIQGANSWYMLLYIFFILLYLIMYYITGGDFSKKNGTGGESIYGGRYCIYHNGYDSNVVTVWCEIVIVVIWCYGPIWWSLLESNHSYVQVSLEMRIFDWNMMLLALCQWQTQVSVPICNSLSLSLSEILTFFGNLYTFTYALKEDCSDLKWFIAYWDTILRRNDTEECGMMCRQRH